MNALYKEAILKAGYIRKQLGLTMFQSLNIFDACVKLGIDVRFVDVNMEGFYVLQNGIPSILISNQRPFPRRAFTCGHELGHHAFGHGLKLDILIDESSQPGTKDDDEILVDAFSAALLMPIGGIQAEFAKRNWNISQGTAIQFYTIASVFGVGYSTLVMHCRANTLISSLKADSLMKFSPAKIFETHFVKNQKKSYFKVIDGYFDHPLVDIEINNYIIVPNYMTFESGALGKIAQTESYDIYVAQKVGIFPSCGNLANKNYFVRVQKEKYIGFAEYRHLEP